MRHILVMLLAGGAGSRLNILARRRAKPAVPFGGIYRIIDFTLSNVMHAGLKRVCVLTQYRPRSLMEHLGDGYSWDLVPRQTGLKVMPPQIGADSSDWYRGTADAVYQNLPFLDLEDVELVLVLSGDHIYRMDYGNMIEFHRRHHAALTIATMPIRREEASSFGMVITDDEGRVVGFQEKPQDPRSNLASMGVYIFDLKVLERELTARIGEGKYDFGHNVIPDMVGRHSLYAYPFQGYWRDVGTFRAYWEANMDLLRPESGIDLRRWEVRTHLHGRRAGDWSASRFRSSSQVEDSLISPGCDIRGHVVHSVLSPGCVVQEGALIKDSIVMHGTVVGEGAILDGVIADKVVVVGDGAIVGMGSVDRPNILHPTHLSDGLTVVGKEAHIPAGLRVGRNVILHPGLREEDYPSTEISTGETIIPRG